MLLYLCFVIGTLPPTVYVIYAKPFSHKITQPITFVLPNVFFVVDFRFSPYTISIKRRKEFFFEQVKLYSVFKQFIQLILYLFVYMKMERIFFKVGLRLHYFGIEIGIIIFVQNLILCGCYLTLW